MKVVTDRDLILAVLGVSGGLTGLVLVFLGLIVNAYAGFDPVTPKKVLDGYRRPAIAILVAFGLGLGCVVIATAWLWVRPSERDLYLATLWLFAAQLVSLVVATCWAVRRILWGS